MAGPRRRWGVLAIALLLACAAAISGSLALPSDAPPAAPDPDCNNGFPRLVLADTAAFEGLAVCSDEAGTGTMIRNESAAVWVVESAQAAPVHLLPLRERARSFTDLLDPSQSSIPSGAAAVVAAPAERLRLTIDARLTLAQLAHDQMVVTPGRRNGPAPAALDPAPTVARRALLTCLAAALQNVESPECALNDGDPAGVLSEAAKAVDSGSGSLCGILWLEAKFNANLASGDQTTFASDVIGWGSNDAFTEQADSASDAYRRLQSAEPG